MKRSWVTLEGNEAAASIAYRLSEVIAIYPITPSTPMGELADAWAAAGKPNLWGTTPLVIEMQSEGGAAGACHGALQRGALTTTFTASQGLLLMIPNMYKIAGELTSTVFHIAARSIATHALSIFGDHQDVMATRQTGWALLASSSVQEAHDLALVAHAATLKARVPFLHFFDGFRTSHEINKIEQLTDDDLHAMIDPALIAAHRMRALTPDQPVIRGTAQNPDVYFQARETVNPFYAATPGIVQETMDRFAQLTGRAYHLFDYTGAPDAERVIVIMGSGAETARETATFLAERGEKVGVVSVRLYRPFSVAHFVAALPTTVQRIAVLDRTKEPGSSGEPLYLDVVTAMAESGRHLPVIGGRYGLASKEFTPAMVKAVFDELAKDQPKNHFTVGIIDDVSHTSLDVDQSFSIESPRTVRCLFYGLGADGTVGANKNSIKIIGEETNNYAQGYFVYDSKKSGSMTVSHLRFGPDPIRAPYLIERANFVACHQFSFLERIDVLKAAEPGAVFLLNSMYGPDEVWYHLPREVQDDIVRKKLKFYVIDGDRVAKESGMGRRVNTVMQTAFFAISGVLPREDAIAEIKRSIKKTYGKRGEAVVQQNYRAVDAALAHLYQVDVEKFAGFRSPFTRRPPVPEQAPEFVKEVLAPMIAYEGDSLPVSKLPVDGSFPTGTAAWEKRTIALEVPVWEPDICIQCGKCAYVCPHAVIRTKVYEPALLEGAPETFLSAEARFKEFPGYKYTLAISSEDCTGCGLCVEVCPAKDKRQVGRKAINMKPLVEVREREVRNWNFFLSIPDVPRTSLHVGSIKNSQLLQPLFEFSGACAGCGETPYIKLLTQLFGDRLLIANATGCSSIYGGNLPTTPYTKNAEGRGPTWCNSLFEDNAEFGLGMRLALDQQIEHVRELLPLFAPVVGQDLVDALLNADQSTEAGIAAQRERVELLKQRLHTLDRSQFPDVVEREHELLSLADVLVKKSVWIVGGDGWAYDIGYGGLDHVLASGYKVNVLVLDTEVYSNTGGQASKSTPIGAVAKFAAKGKSSPKKDLGLIAMAYGNIYVARVAMGADDVQTLRAFMEAEAYDGPSLIIAYSHCIAHGIDMRKGLDQQKLAVQTGYWPLYRYNPSLAAEGKNPLIIDSKDPSLPLEKFIYNETRYRMLVQSDPERAEMLLHQAEASVRARWQHYKELAALSEVRAERDGH
ncbi:pyruvate:ferredoxin (flavodoxin) oxidoreductase [Roseiflexus sp. RS-1]|uniref:pyruvate:ferredoxin (flavodoxin) oxidoreductase n=1 Tax=Roseiflexus sp. (strain RS-1) TaxID=357808 RepID=UPI0000D81603|nr:pyruvate:ferredoxin (flavodoxin) oxidoreductase [Roseiflexus sp. RS-1]ABQ89620.1 pyruvate flavodoxin/ferredoxin oxidoreductase domain protein [Roseiflexus sp. RS-1]